MTFSDFVAARLGALVRYATVVTWDAHLAEDVVQNVLVRAQARWGRIQAMEEPERYLRRMIVNEFLSWRRRRAARLVHVGEGLDGLAPPSGDATGRYDDRDAVIRLIGTLPPRQRAVIALRFYEDLPVEAIADVLGCRGQHRAHPPRPGPRRAARVAARRPAALGRPAMSERIEALVRDAQEAVAAGGAPDLDRIRHALPVLARRRARRRRAGLAVVAAAAVLVAGFAVVTLGDRGPGRTVPAGPPPPDPSTAATAAPGPSARDRDVNLVYELVDPPQHLREKVRTIADTPDGLVITRVWTDRNVGTGLAVAAGQPSLVLTVRPGRELPPGETVDLLGTPGSYTQQAATARLAWTDFTPDPAGRIVQLDAIGLGMSRDSLANLQHRVRRSGVRFDSPLTLGWGPGARARYTSSIGGDDGRSITAIVTADASAEHAGVLTVSLAPRPDVLPQGEAVSVHGRPAELIEDTDPATGRPRQRIVQESSDNQALLTVTFTNPDGPLLSQWDVVRAADSVRSALDFNGEWLTG